MIVAVIADIIVVKSKKENNSTDITVSEETKENNEDREKTEEKVEEVEEEAKNETVNEKYKLKIITFQRKMNISMQMYITI